MKHSNAPLVSLLLVAVAIVTLFNFTLPGYREQSDLTSQSQDLDNQIAAKQKELAALQDQQKKADKDLVAQYQSRFREDKVIGLLFDSPRGSEVQIGDFSLSDGGKTANGLSIGTVSLAPVFKDVDGLKTYLDWLSRNNVVLSSLAISHEKSGRDDVVRAPMTIAIHYAQ